MNIRKVASLSLAVALQVLPITRVFVASTSAAGSSFAIVSAWIAGALALMGGVDAVSGASSIAISPATATAGVPYSGILQYSGAHASSAKSWELKNNWQGSQSGCNTAYEIAPGLWLTNASTYLLRVGGTPTAGGTFNFTVKIWSGSGCSGGDSDTRSATITVSGGTVTAPSITTQPLSQTVTAGANVSFTVVATGTAPLTYQWKQNGANVSGGTSASLSQAGVTTAQAGSYTCTVGNTAGSVTSSAATLTVNPAVVAPTITTQPVSQMATAGANVSFTVAASGTASLSYQWRLNGANLGGATSATLNLTGVTTGQAGSYTCLVTNSAGSATSSAATLTVNPAAVAPTITTQPLSQTVTAGANASFTVVATGTAPLTYQWKQNGANVSGGTSATLNLTSVTTAQAGSYTCLVTNSAGNATSSAATLTVNPAAVSPTIATQPLSQTVTAGANVSFTVLASGTAPLSYQWQLNGANVGGATSATLSLTSVTTAQAGSYTCTVGNSVGSTTSSPATLTVTTVPIAPTITTQPVSQTVTAGANVIFTVAASGTAPLSYQWRLNGANVGGATSATLSLTSVTTGQAGSYSCMVGNAAGSVTSSAATLTVNPAVVAPTITTQPIGQTVMAGANLSFTVVATGTAPLTYQWKQNGANVSGGTSATLNLTSVTTAQAGSYTCMVGNTAGSVTSSAAMLTVNAAPVAPTITTQPVSQTVTAGANVSFAVAASGTSPLTYQWQRNGVNVGGAGSATLSLTGVTTNQAGSYACVVTNLAGIATSSAATLAVNPASIAPIITLQPVGQTVATGANVSFTVMASGSTPLSYQWRRNGANIAGATAATFSLSNVTTNWAGSYTCVVMNGAGSATSAAATLIVQPGAPQASMLTVIVQGQGTLSPNLNGAMLTIGQSYSMTVTPATGYEFGGWSGSIVSSSPTLTFVMASNLVLQANFVASPYVAASATYNGLFNEPAEVRLNSSGAFNVHVGTSGDYSGWLQSGFTRYPFSGKLDLNLRGTNVISRWNSTTLTIELNFGQVAQTGLVSGRVTDGVWNAPLSGGRATGASLFAGEYTVVIPGLVGSARIPAGDGYATLSVAADGSASLSGTLADGAQFMQSALVSDDGDLPVYVSLYSAQGVVMSWLNFANLSSSDVSGTLVWIKQAGASAASYPLGFTNSTKAVGSLYVAPAATGKVLNLSSASVGFFGGELGANFSNPVSVNAGSQVVNLSPNAMTMGIATGAGTFAGQVVDPGTGVTHNFGGVVLQKQNAGYGFMTGVNASSRVVFAVP